MPTIGFFELLLISVVALLVLGPERLPGAIRTTSLWVGRARRSFNKVRSEIERELNADEIRRQLHNESILADLDKAKKQARELTANANRELKKLGNDIEAGVSTEPGVSDPGPDQVPDPAPDALSDQAAEEVSEKLAEQTAIQQSNETQDGTADESPVASPATPAAPAPVQDFYNNPGTGTVELRGGVVHSAEPAAPPSDESVKK
jgi:sec-independent protein translocase protein TatB